MTVEADQLVEAGPLAWTEEDDAEELLETYRLMRRIRLFEEEIQRLFLKGEVPGTTHLCIGQEAVCAGLGASLEPEDVLSNTYRGHGHALAKGVNTEGLAAEMLARSTGLSGGRAGSLNIIDMSSNMIGCYPIIGGSIGAVGGVGLALKDSGRVGVAVFGDGTTNQGYFFECLNFAKVQQLPIVYVCENNGYGEYTPWRVVTAGKDICARASAFGIPATRADGMDVRSVRAVVGAAVDRARAGEGPQFVECVTYRFVGHSRSDPALYRPEGELEEWKLRDPLVLTHEQLTSLGVKESEIDSADAEVADDVSRAFELALAAPSPDWADVKEYADV